MLEPLTELTTCESLGVAVVSRRTARLFRGGARAPTEFAAFDANERLSVHVRQVAERLARAHKRQRFAHLVIVARAELRGAIEAVSTSS